MSKEGEPKVFITDNGAIIGSFDAVRVVSARGIQIIAKESFGVKEWVALPTTRNVEAGDLFLENL